MSLLLLIKGVLNTFIFLFLTGLQQCVCYFFSVVSFHNGFLCDILLTAVALSSKETCTVSSGVSNIIPSLFCPITWHIFVSSDMHTHHNLGDSIFSKLHPITFEKFPTTSFLPFSNSFLVDSLPLCYKSGGGRRRKLRSRKSKSKLGRKSRSRKSKLKSKSKLNSISKSRSKSKSKLKTQSKLRSNSRLKLEIITKLL